MSLAVTVAVCTVFSVTLNCCVPEESAAFAGRVALVPDEVIPTVSVGAVVTLFQYASTAFTVTVNDDPADRALGLPVLPLPLLDVPGAAVSPGSKRSGLGSGGGGARLVRPGGDEKPRVADVGP